MLSYSPKLGPARSILIGRVSRQGSLTHLLSDRTLGAGMRTKGSTRSGMREEGIKSTEYRRLAREAHNLRRKISQQKKGCKSLRK